MAEIYEKGQVVIPKYIRDMFKLKPGDEVVFRVEEQKIVIEPATNALEEFRRLRLHAKRGEAETDKLIEENKKRMEKEWLSVH